MKKIALLLMTVVLLFGLVGYASAVPVVIDFDDQPQLGVTGGVITNQYGGVLFSSTAGFVNYITTQPSYNSTKPNFLCTGPVGGSINCTAETILTFATPVSNLTFDGMGINNVGKVAEIDVYVSGILAATLDVIGNSQGLDPVPQDLSAYSNITQIRIHDITDGAGIGWDTFKYDQAGTAVPEASTLLLLGSGLAGLGGITWRHRKS